MTKKQLDRTKALQTAILVFIWGIVAVQLLILIGKLVEYIQ